MNDKEKEKLEQSLKEWKEKCIEINANDISSKLEDLKKELESTKVVYEKEMEEKPKKPLEFKIIKDEVFDVEMDRVYNHYKYIYFYADGTIKEYTTDKIPDGLVLGRHYHIDDMYGYSVIDDREGL